MMTVSSINGTEVFPFYISETIYMPCFTEEHRDRMEAARNELGADVWDMLYQARGWAFVWLEGRDENDVTVRSFIERVDDKLCLTRKEHNDDTNSAA